MSDDRRALVLRGSIVVLTLLFIASAVGIVWVRLEGATLRVPGTEGLSVEEIKKDVSDFIPHE